MWHWGLHSSQNLAFICRIKFVLVEEAHQPALPRLQSNFTCKVGNSELFDYFKDINLTVQLFLGISLEPVNSLTFFAYTTTPSRPKYVHTEAAPVRVLEYLTINYSSFQAFLGRVFIFTPIALLRHKCLCTLCMSLLMLRIFVCWIEFLNHGRL